MKALLLTTGSLFLTSVVLGNAYYQKKQFYPSVVYITKSNPSMAVLYLQAFVMVILMGKLMRKVFFGQLRAAEMEHLIERSWYAVTETCLAFTVFRDDFSPRFVSLFTLLLFLKCFHWLAEDRVDYMERSPLISWLFHLRVISLLGVLGVGDLYFINHAYYSTLIKGASVQLVFGFEYAILLTVVLTIFMKYVLHTIDLQSENPWENKAVFLLYTELVMGFIKVVLYVTFLAIMIKVHTFPLFAIRPMYLTMRAFKKALNDVIMSRRAIRNMNTLYPDATPEELQSSDNVCIICREEMTTGAKKLPCNHIFHKSCLRSWFQRQQTCPTCRMDVLRAPTVRQPQQQPQQQQAQPQVANMFPGFPAGFPMWPPVPQQPAAAAPGSTSTPAAGTTTTTTATAGASGAQTSTTDSSQAGASGSMPFMMPPFMMPMPFMVPPPVPPVDLASMTEEELQAMEGRERQHLEARIQCLRNIHTLLDAAVVQLQQYTNIITSLGLNNVYTSSSGTSSASAAAASSSTPTTSSASSSNTTSSATTASSTQPASDLSLPRPASTSSAPAAAAQSVSSPKEESPSSKSSDKIDYNDLEGAVGFTPPTVENIPEWQNAQEEQEEDLKEIRRRRVERFSSQNADDKKE